MDMRRIAATILSVCVFVCGSCRTEADSTTEPQPKKISQRCPKAERENNSKSAAADEHPEPTFSDVRYGPHERNVLDFYQAESDKSTPVVMHIHGGGFEGGDKNDVNPDMVSKCMRSGVSVVAINYRFLKHAPIQDILRDAARAVQFLRYKSNKWNIDKERIASYGDSAGAGTSLWLAFHDDLANPESKDPVLRESSRLAVAGAFSGQFSHDLNQWAEVIGASPSEMGLSISKMQNFYGLKDPNDINSPVGQAIRADVDTLGVLTKDDAPVFLYSGDKNTKPVDFGHYVHHPRHSIAVKRKCDRLGVECKMLLKAEDPSLTKNIVQEEMLKFFFKHLKVSP